MDIKEITHQVEKESVTIRQIVAEIEKVIVGQTGLINRMLIGLLCEGHLLLEGLPGLAKTTAVKAMAQTIDTSFKRIQFTPDLLPADIIGTQIYRPDNGSFEVNKGPIFNNIILADEINRAPAKVQSALLEAMQEHQVTIRDTTFKLDDPFLVMATQNPIEQEGTYPLPEAQLDRFMFNIIVDYPTAAEELDILKLVTGTHEADIEPSLSGEDILRLQDVVRRVPMAEHVFEYARDIARASRPKTPEAPDFIHDMVAWGAGPRAGIYMCLGAKARAVLRGRYHATTDDVREVALPVLRHRVITTFNAEAAGVTSDDVVDRLLEEIQPVVDESVA